MKTVRALVLNGYGINCEKEMAQGATLAGAQVHIAHVKSWVLGELNVSDYDLLLLPGGFSFGDELGAAKACANRIIFSKKREDLLSFIHRGKCIFGICNGFQLLIKLGILPGWDSLKPQAVLMQNARGKFESRWVSHKVLPSRCIFTKDVEELYLPIRHGEGNFMCLDPDRLFSEGHVVLQYAPENPNGSQASIAGICDKTGRVFGMMAHPEAALFFTQLPDWTRYKESCKRQSSPLPVEGPGLTLFTNAINYLRQT